MKQIEQIKRDVYDLTRLLPDSTRDAIVLLVDVAYKQGELSGLKEAKEIVKGTK